MINSVNSSCYKKIKFNISLFLLYFKFLTSRDHLPRGYSAQGWVDMKGHLVKPSWESSSFGLDERIIDRVPIGDLFCSMREIKRFLNLYWKINNLIKNLCKKSLEYYLINNSTSPRLVAFTVITAWTCSK